jgi:hypothetical protein
VADKLLTNEMAWVAGLNRKVYFHRQRREILRYLLNVETIKAVVKVVVKMRHIMAVVKNKAVVVGHISPAPEVMRRCLPKGLTLRPTVLILIETETRQTDTPLAAT